MEGANYAAPRHYADGVATEVGNEEVASVVKGQTGWFVESAESRDGLAAEGDCADGTSPCWRDSSAEDEERTAHQQMCRVPRFPAVPQEGDDRLRQRCRSHVLDLSLIGL